MENMGRVHICVSCEYCSLIEAFKLSSIGVQMAKLRSKPGCRKGEGDSLYFNGARVFRRL